MKYKNLTIIGTSHIAKESVNEIQETIKKIRPDLIAVELDKQRLNTLMMEAKYGVRKKEKGMTLRIIKSIGLKGYLFSLIGAWAQKKLGKIVNIQPGADMLEAVKIAKKENIPVALIDRDIQITLKRFSKYLTWKEKFTFITEIITQVLFRKKQIPFDIRKVPSKKIIKQLLDEVKIKYPNVHRTLISERNEVMAKRLYNLMNRKVKTKEDMETEKKGQEIISKEHNAIIVAVVGAGHEEEIIRLIKEYENKNSDLSYNFNIALG